MSFSILTRFSNFLILVLILVNQTPFCITKSYSVEREPRNQQKLAVRILSYNLRHQSLIKEAPFLFSSLSENNPDLIALQNIKHSERKDVQNILKQKGFLYFAAKDLNLFKHRYLGRGFLGSGLMIASKYPISQSQFISFEQYTLNKEYFYLRGAFHAEIQLPKIGGIDVYNASLGPLSKKSIQEHESFEARFHQAYELIEFIRATKRNDLIVLAIHAGPYSNFFDHGKNHYDQKVKSPEYYLFTDKSHLSLCDGMDITYGPKAKKELQSFFRREHYIFLNSCFENLVISKSNFVFAEKPTTKTLEKGVFIKLEISKTSQF